MNYSDYRFSLDVQQIGSQVFMSVKVGDTSRRLIISLTDGHEPYDITEGCVAVFAAVKADGNVIFNNCTIDGNSIVYEFTEQTVAAEGSMRCEIQLYGGDESLLCSPNFTIAVLPSQVGGNVESLTEVNTLTGLINGAVALIAEVNADLESGAFVPELEIGLVETLPTGANATASITGTGKNPVLNLGLPAGPVGSADGLVFDTELSPDSTNPVQNKVLFAEFETVREEFETVREEQSEALEDKVDKVSGKGLSTNDYTNTEKQKLAGIEDGANRFVLSAGDVSQSVTVVLLVSGWNGNSQTVNAPIVTADNTVIVSPQPASYEAYTENAVRCTAQGAGTLSFVCESAPSGDISVNVTVINK